MNRRILILLMGIVVVLILISGYAGSLNTNPAQAGGSDQGTAKTPAAPQAEPGNSDTTVSTQGSQPDVPAGQTTLGNAVGHYIRQ